MSKAQSQTAESLDDFLLEFDGIGDFKNNILLNDVLGFFGGRRQQGGSLTLNKQ